MCNSEGIRIILSTRHIPLLERQSSAELVDMVAEPFHLPTGAKAHPLQDRPPACHTPQNLSPERGEECNEGCVRGRL